ncbi:n-acetylneuraminate lyase [Limosa lapponica baueri]|uniref:N-acetylneuraminate lyase n=1 Tax=Limosa lapponica baueri TaxID=1758121 RepID=A0A2I0THT4_LIMLA|nr:n-acetylneuraminate lyase [Limosa lapponica baueri]
MSQCCILHQMALLFAFRAINKKISPSFYSDLCLGRNSLLKFIKLLTERSQISCPDAPQRCPCSWLSSMTPRKKLQGLVAATVTPMTPDGQINLSVIRQYVDYLVSEQNVKSVFVNGTTGEGLSLNTQERKQLAEEWVCQGKDKLDHVIIHVGALSLPESQELARHAAAIGASGIAVIAPFFFKPTNKDELIAFLQKVASEAPAVPFYYYHIPPLTGVKSFGVAQTKAIMTFVSGIPMGPPRLPLVGASEEFIAKAKAKLNSIVWPDGN